MRLKTEVMSLFPYHINNNFLKPKFQASSHLLWLCGLVCVGPGRKPENRFLCDAAHDLLLAYQKQVIKAYDP